MKWFIFRRLWLAALVCLTVLVVSFILTRLSGDLAASIAGPNASAADIAIITKNYGLDRPLVVQFLDWAGHAAEGDLGRSFLYHVPVWGLIRDRLPVTLTLGLTGLAIALLVALPLGILAAVREGNAYLQAHPQQAWDGFVKTHKDLDNTLNKTAWFQTLPYFAADPFALDAKRYTDYAAFMLAHKLIAKQLPLATYAVQLQAPK